MGRKCSVSGEAIYVCGISYYDREAYTAGSGEMPGEEDEQQDCGSVSAGQAGAGVILEYAAADHIFVEGDTAYGRG